MPCDGAGWRTLLVYGCEHTLMMCRKHQRIHHHPITHPVPQSLQGPDGSSAYWPGGQTTGLKAALIWFLMSCTKFTFSLSSPCEKKKHGGGLRNGGESACLQSEEVNVSSDL